MTMRMVGLMQEVPNRDKRKARSDVAQASVERAAASVGLPLSRPPWR